MSTLPAHLVAIALTNEKGRKTLGWVVALTLSPVILLAAFLCCFGTAAVAHNDFAVSASFYGAAFSDEIPVEYESHIAEMRKAFALLDAAVSEVLTDENDDWLNVYANYDMERGAVCDTLELTLCKGDGTEEDFNYSLNTAEKEVLLRKMDEFCQQQTGMSLTDYAWQLREEQRMQM